jgi:hypothetical protein
MGLRFCTSVIDAHDRSALERFWAAVLDQPILYESDAEVERLIGLGATRADIGQGDDVSWGILAGPEGNEFRVLRRHRSLVE